MGCGESKNAVATGNTVSASEKSNAAGETKKIKDVETIPERVTDDNNTTNPPPQQEEREKEMKKQDPETDKAVEAPPTAAVADAKEITETTELKELEGDDDQTKEPSKDEEEENDEGGVVVEEQEQGRLISRDSPNHYFSSRKDHEEAIDSIEGKSDYETPRHYDNDTESVLKVSEIEAEDDAVEERETEAKPKVEINEEPVNVKEEKLIKEEEAAVVAVAVEAKISTATGEEKSANGGEDQGTDSSTKDPRSN